LVWGDWQLDSPFWCAYLAEQPPDQTYRLKEVVMYIYEFKGKKPIKTLSGLVIASDFTRVVLGNRGAYVEFGTEHINLDVMNIKAARHYFYTEYATTDGIKVYYQIHKVSYADYIPGMWYISPIHLQGFERTGKYIYDASALWDKTKSRVLKGIA
jgi:hypothetical protein